MTARPIGVSRIGLGAGAAYVALVFPLAFAFGIVRTLLAAPRLGDTLAVLVETPLILAVSWWASAWCVRALQVPPRAAPRLAMGATAFGLLMAAELGLSVLVFGRTVEVFLGAFLSPAGALGLAAQLGFALIPVLQMGNRRQVSRHRGVFR